MKLYKVIKIDPEMGKVTGYAIEMDGRLVQGERGGAVGVAEWQWEFVDFHGRRRTLYLDQDDLDKAEVVLRSTCA